MIGKDCAIARRVRINPDNHPLDRVGVHPFTYCSCYCDFGEDELCVFKWRASKPVSIGHDVWGGCGATAIDMGRVVTKAVAAYAMVIGDVSKKNHKCFTGAQIQFLEVRAGRVWLDEHIKSALMNFRHLSVDAFIEKYT